MTTSPVGITIHALGAITVPTSTSMASQSRNLQYGDEMVLTAEVIEALRDRNGRVRLLELLDDEPAQVRVWSEVKIRRGPWPSTDDPLDRIQPDSPQWDDARTAALQAAALLPDPSDQRR
jgi:hypothetical protein